jgi:RND family efflux transporter MFP subunit
LLLVGLLVASAWAGRYLLGQRGEGSGALLDASLSASRDPNALSVHTVFPKRKTLERSLVQPGTIKPFAQVELFAKASGYLRAIQGDMTAEIAADLAAHHLAIALAGGHPGFLAASAAVAWSQAPPKDIGSTVRAGEQLLAIASPESEQEIVERRMLVAQREAELEQAKTAVATAEALVAAARAAQLQAEASVKKAAADHAYYSKQLTRLRELVRRDTIAPEVAEEKEHLLQAALAALETNQARVLAAQADLSLADSKRTTAKADVAVKEALVRVAREQLHRAIIVADYANVYAPFDGIITQRGVDLGDFVHNSSGGALNRPLMTVTALDRVKVVLAVPAHDAIFVEVGAEAVVKIDALHGWRVQSRVARVDHLLDRQTMSMRVEIDLDNRDHRLLPGMYANVALTLQKLPDAWAIPATAIYSRRGENYILVVDDQGRVRRHRVRVRYDDGKEVEVVRLDGDRETPLTGREQLVVSNKGELADGQPVRPLRDAIGP